MASKEPSSHSKIPKFRTSAPNSPRMPATPTPPASQVVRKPILEKSKSNLSSTSRIPLAASSTFRKRQLSSIPCSTPATPPTPGSKSKLPTLQGKGSKIPTTHRSNIPSLRNAGAVLRPRREVATASKLEAPVSPITPLVDQSSAKSQGDTILMSPSDPMSQMKKKTHMEVIHQAPVSTSDESLFSVSSPSLVEFEVAEVELKSSRPVETTPDSLLKTQQLFFDEVAQSAAIASMEISPQHFQLPFSCTLSPLGGSASQDKAVIAPEPVTMLEGKPSLIRISPKESTTGAPCLAVEDFEWSIPGTKPMDTDVLHPPTTFIGMDDQPCPYAYGESFQLREVPEDLAIVEKGNTLTGFKIDTEDDSDYGFFFEDDDEEDELEVDTADSASDMEQGDSNDVLLLSTMIHSKVIDGHGGGRKTKTIFSVDAPTAQAQNESGPGVNGDGVGAPRRPSSKIVSSSSTSGAKDDIQVLFHKDRRVAPQYEDVNTEEDDEDELHEWPEEEDKCPRLNTANGYIEILPKMESHSKLRRSSSTGCSKAFSLILQRSSEKVGKEFSKSLEICNMTPVMHGFKVWCNSSAYTHLDITPIFGLIQPGRRLSVEISTKNPGVHPMAYDMDKYQIEVKIFPAYCSNLDELERYYKKLKEQRPDLITSQPIQRMILWDAGDISGRLELFNSIEDEEEQDSLKEELHNIQLGQCPSVLASESATTAASSLFDYLQGQITDVEQNLKENLETTSGILHLQRISFVMMFVFIMGSLILPAIFPKDLGNQKALPEPEVTAECMWDRLLKMFGLK